MSDKRCIKRYYLGTHKSPRDERDYLLRGFFLKEIALPSKFSLVSKMTPVKNQGAEGSCIGFAMVVGVKEYQETTGKDAQPGIELSPRFLYEEAKKISGHKEGTTLKAAMQVASKLGVCEYYYWPYSPNFVGEPQGGAYKNALQYKIKTYARVNGIEELKRAIFDPTIGPTLIGVKVYKGMVSDEAKVTGVVPDPTCWDRMNVLGGHALCAVGYNDDFAFWKNKGGIIVKNSWSTNWGDKGYGYLSYDYIEKNMLDAFSAIDIDKPYPLTIDCLTYRERKSLRWI